MSALREFWAAHGPSPLVARALGVTRGEAATLLIALGLTLVLTLGGLPPLLRERGAGGRNATAPASTASERSGQSADAPEIAGVPAPLVSEEVGGAGEFIAPSKEDGGADGGLPAGSRHASGTSSYVDGVFVWTDYAYDDRGPDTNFRAGGDAAYPTGMTPNNVADLIQLQVRDAGGRLGVTAVLETLTDGTKPVIGIAIDSDGQPGGAPSLPGSWIPSAALGVDRLAVLERGRGRWFTYRSGNWTETGTFAVAVDDRENTLTARLPFEVPASGRLRAVSAVGYEQDGRSWLDGASPVHDLAFVPGEDPVAPYLQGVTDAIVNFAAGGDPVWQDYQQSAILAGEADPAAAIATIDVAKLRGGHTDPPALLDKGFHTFLYRSRLDLGEGVQPSGTSVLFAGPYQPYLVWAPGVSTRGLPLVLYLHGSSQTHLSTVNTAPYSPESRDALLGLPNAFFDHFKAVVAWPLGRGPAQTYNGASQQDILDVHEDVVTRLALNQERVMLAGLSLGGIGTFRLAELYPDRWSLAYSDVGYDQVGLAENLTALPLRFQNGGPDYLVHVYNALLTRDLLERAGTVDYRSFILHQRHHQPAVALAECIYRASFDLDRVRNPARVRYTIDPAMFQVDDKAGLNLTYGGAYWVDGMRSAGGKASVNLLSHAFGYRPEPAATARAVQQNVTQGWDFCGPNAAVSTRDTWDEQAKAVARAPIPPKSLVEGTLTNLTAVTIAADRAGVANGTLVLTTDRPMTLTLTGLTPGARVTAGAQQLSADGDGVVAVSLTRGETAVRIAAPG